jgi:aryl-alcohol dehydrogenase-like predicted oxidoreductase
MLVGRALAGIRDKVQLSVKFGALRGPDNTWNGVDTRPAAVKNFLAYSLKRLGVDVIDVYRPARLDPAVPIEDTVGAIADMIKAGYVRHVGLSEVGVETIRRAAKVHPIADLQIEYAVVSRGPEKTIFPALTALGISATLYGVLSRGLLTGSAASSAASGDMRAFLPRFAGENGKSNARVADKVRAFAEERGMTPAQLLIAWARAKQPAFVPVIGARTRKQIDDAIDAVDKSLSPADVSALETLIPADAVVGTRYPEAQMKHLDSEK